MLAIVSNAAINLRMQTPLEDTDFVSFGYISRSGIAGSFGCSVCDFEETRHFFHSGCTMYIPTNSKGSLFSLSLPTLFIACFFFFFNNHCDGCEVICPCGFDLHFPDGESC